MRLSEVEEFAAYEVYELIGEKEDEYHCLCVCKEYKVATIIAKLLAMNDLSRDKYYVSNVSIPNTLVPGGGWYDCYYRDEEGKLRKDSLS